MPTLREPRPLEAVLPPAPRLPEPEMAVADVAQESAPEVIPAPAPAPIVAVAPSMQFAGSGNSAGVVYPGASTQFRVMQPTMPVPVVAPVFAVAAAAPPVERTLADRLKLMLHPDVMLPLVAALIVLVMFLAWAP